MDKLHDQNKDDQDEDKDDCLLLVRSDYAKLVACEQSQLIVYSLFLNQEPIVHKEVRKTMAQATNYEVTYIIKPDLDDERKAALVKHYDEVLSTDGAEVVDSKDWSKRRFAYEIDDYRDGIYHVVNVKANDAKAINEFDRLSKIDNAILRHMIVRRDDKN